MAFYISAWSGVVECSFEDLAEVCEAAEEDCDRQYGMQTMGDIYDGFDGWVRGTGRGEGYLVYGCNRNFLVERPSQILRRRR